MAAGNAQVETVADAFLCRIVGNLAGNRVGVVGQHIPVGSGGIRLAVAMERFEDDHVAANVRKGVDGLAKIPLIFFRTRHLWQRVEKVIVDVAERRRQWLEIVEGKGAHGAALVAVKRDVTRAIRIPKGAGAVFDQDARFFVDADELGFTLIAFPGVQDQARFKTERYALFGQFGLIERVFNAGKEATLGIADKLDRRGHPKGEVVDDLGGGCGKNRIAQRHLVQPERRLVGEFDVTAKKAIGGIQLVDQIQRHLRKSKVKDKSIRRRRDAAGARRIIGKASLIALHGKAIGGKTIGFGGEVIFNRQQATSVCNSDGQFGIGKLVHRFP